MVIICKYLIFYSIMLKNENYALNKNHAQDDIKINSLN